MYKLHEDKIDRCQPAVQLPEGWDASHTANHWSNEASMIQYLNKIVIQDKMRCIDDTTVPASPNNTSLTFSKDRKQKKFK